MRRRGILSRQTAWTGFRGKLAKRSREREGCCRRGDEREPHFYSSAEQRLGVGKPENVLKRAKTMRSGKGGGSPVQPGPRWRWAAVVTGTVEH